ncbi:hypothetical protein ABFA07_008214 [Porites harrisoni]
MKRVLQVVTVLSSCFLLHFKVAFSMPDPGTVFTKKPGTEGTVYGIQGSNVTFHWTLAFGNSDDWKNFIELDWGTTQHKDYHDIDNKYVTVTKKKKVKNPNLDASVKSRVDATLVNCSQSGCDVIFVIRSVTKKDAKYFYNCIANIDYDHVKSGPISLVISEPPRITKRSNATIDLEEGDNATLQCTATGKPLPSITWTKDNRELLNESTTLVVPNIQLKDAGTYICKAKNPVGTASYSIHVRVVRYRPHINMTTSSKADEKSWLHHKTSLKCAVNANPPANFTWFKDDRPILDGFNSSQDISTLTLTPKTAGDFGLYSCKATNNKGSAWHNITLAQLYPPGQPIISKLVPDMLSISVHWNKSRDNGGSDILDHRIRLLDAENKVQQVHQGIRNNYFSLRNLRQNRTYVIVLQSRNVIGYGKEKNVTVSTLEGDPPIILGVTAIPSLLAVNISWNSTNNNTGIEILDYKLVIIDTKTQRRREIFGINVSNHYVTNLTHNTTYRVMVQARNEIGYGKSVSRNVTTLKADPPGPPMINVVPSTFSLEINWNSSVQDINNIQILDYKIKVIDGTTHKEVAHHTAVTRSRLLVKHLVRNRTYTVEVQARNEVGYGATANISAKTLLAGPPEAPLITNITVNGIRCILRWKKPYNGESPIQMYSVSVWKLLSANNGSHYKDRLGSWNTNGTNFTLDVEWNHNYTTSVSAWNKHGQSVSSAERQFKTELQTTPRNTEVFSTIPSVIHEDTSSTLEVASQWTKPRTVSQVKKDRSGAKEEVKRNTFTYLAPLWIVILAFAVPAVVFMLWKGTQKIMRRCRRPRFQRRRKFHNRDSESSATVILDEVQARTEANHYETITEIVETQLNHGFTMADEKISGNDYTLKQPAIPGYNAVYNHLFETKTGPMKQTNLESGLGMFPNDVYSHLIHGEPFTDKREHKVLNRSVPLASKSEWEISRERLQIKGTIGHGEFGLVKKGFALDVSKNGGWVPVAVKMVNENEGPHGICRKNLLSELKVMKELSPHKHVVQLLACITKSEPLCVITEFAPYGDLLGFLRKKRGFSDGYYNIEYLPQRNLTSKKLMQFASEIADGMAFLSSEKIVHRDLAARNILLGENLTCKVTDFGMARDIREMDMYQKTTAGRLPVKWTALEALLHGLYTTKSDVWSFGVVLFEIATMGGCPYPDLEVLDLINKLENGYRMEKPTHLCEELYSVMLSCWNEDPGKRPTFSLLSSTLSQLNRKNEDCIDLKTYNGNLYENFQVPSK